MRTSRFLVAFGLVLIVAFPTSAAAAPDVSADNMAQSLAAEASLGAFQDEAMKRGALGSYRDDATGELVIVVPSNASAFSMPVSPAGVSARLQARDIDPARLARALAKISDLGPELTSGNGASLSSWFNPKLGLVDVAGTVDEGVIKVALGDLWDLIRYRPGISVVPASRNFMDPPFEGGGQAKRVGSTNAYDCTTGFTVKKTSNGARYMLTAAHCGASLSDWISPGSGFTIGTMRFRQNGTTDVALLGDKTYQPVIYTGGGAGTASTVKGASNPVINNTSYCYSGATTLEHCTVTVLSLSTNNCYSGACYTNQMSFQQFGSCPARGGDSGGPFYLDFSFGGFPYIRGTVNASLSDNSLCFGEVWTRLAGAMGVTIVTG